MQIASDLRSAYLTTYTTAPEHRYAVNNPPPFEHPIPFFLSLFSLFALPPPPPRRHSSQRDRRVNKVCPARGIKWRFDPAGSSKKEMTCHRFEKLWFLDARRLCGFVVLSFFKSLTKLEDFDDGSRKDEEGRIS